MSRLKDAINILLELRIAENIPEFYKPVITKIINTLINDVQEEQHGHWNKEEDTLFRLCVYKCSLCGGEVLSEAYLFKYCPYCGCAIKKLDMKGEEDEIN